MSKFKKKSESSQDIPTAALPDIIFMLLFFFMVTTTMRETNLVIENPRLPNATEVKKLEDKSLVSTIYVGKSKDPNRDGVGFNKIQLNDKISTADQVPAFIFGRRDKIAEALHPFMTTSIKADRESSVGTIIDIRLKLRDVNALKISYSTQTGNEE